MSPRLSRRLPLLALVAALVAPPAAAQVATDIRADVEPGRSLGTTVVTAGTIHTVDGGTLSGGNLFHSFSRFTLGSGELAQWTRAAGGAAGIANVISRVTGGDASQIFGTIDSTALPNASFYFINPAGIVFGAGAQVNVSAAAFFSTASEIGFADGSRFTVATPGGSTFSMAPPQSFGFLGSEAPLVLNGVTEGFVPNFTPLSLSGTSVGVFDSATLVGSLRIAAVGAAADIPVEGTPSFALGGDLLIADSSLVAGPSALSDGSVSLAAGTISMDAGFIATAANGDRSAGDLLLSAGTIDIFNQSGLFSNTQSAGDAGNLFIFADSLFVADSNISTLSSSTGDAGDVVVSAGRFDATGMFMGADGFGEGRAGDIDLSAGTMIIDTSFIGSQPNQQSNSGSISLRGGTLQLLFSELNSDTLGTGAGGNIVLDFAAASILDSGISANSAFGGSGIGGDAGSVAISADDLFIARSRISSTASTVCNDGCTGGNAGGIALTGERILLQEAQLASDALGAGDAGAILVEGSTSVDLVSTILRSDAVGACGGGSCGGGVAGAIDVRAASVTIDNATISSETGAGGSGGAQFVTIEATNALRLFDTFISTIATGAGQAGAILLSGDTVDIAGTSVDPATSVVSSSTRSTGAAGFVVVSGGDVSLDFAILQSTALEGSTGDAGQVVINATRSIELSTSLINVDAFGEGAAGQIALFGGTGSISLDGSFITSDSTGPADAGFVLLSTTGSVSLLNSVVASSAIADSNGGLVAIEAGLLDAVGSQITSDARGLGTGGGVLLTMGTGSLRATGIASNALLGNGGSVGVAASGELILAEGSFISSDVGGFGDAGDVTVGAGSLLMTGGSFISSDAVRGSLGDAGDVTVTTNQLVLEQGSFISSDALGDGSGGSIEVIASDTLTLDDRSYISSDVGGFGNAGGVNVTAGALRATNGSLISSNALNDSFGNAGNVTVTALSIALESGAFIASDALGEGNGGTVLVEAADALSLADRSYISSDAGGAGDAGGVTVGAADLILSDRSFISSTALAGSTGNAGGLNVAADTLALSGASSIQSNARGAGDAGGVGVSGRDISLADASFISSDAFGAGSAGGVSVAADILQGSGASFISSDALGEGDGGTVDLTVSDTLALTNGASLSSSTTGAGNAGGVFITGGALQLTDARIVSNAEGEGNAGGIFIDSASAMLQSSRITSEAATIGNGGEINIQLADGLSLSNANIATDARGAGDAGNVSIAAQTIALSDQSFISSDALPGSSGESGSVSIVAEELTIGSGSFLSTTSANELIAGEIFVDAGDLLLQGSGANIASENSFTGGGDAGEILIQANAIRLLDGARITTSSVAGAAGNIGLLVPAGGIIRLESRGDPSTITTSSGPGTGGLIVIQSPRAVILNGGSILALGDVGNAFVTVDAQYFITSSDRINTIAVDGSLEFVNAISDVSSGIVNRDLSVLDASNVLRGQCPAARATGQFSELTVRTTGPYAAQPIAPSDAEAPTSATLGPGGCK